MDNKGDQEPGIDRMDNKGNKDNIAVKVNIGQKGQQGMEAKERIDALDGYRGIACCIIAFLWHYLNMQPKDRGMPFQSVFGFFYNYGQYAVEFFFVLSGFVMCYCYKDRIASGTLGFGDYIRKRYQHMYPLLFVTLCVTAGLQYLYKLATGGFHVYECSLIYFFLNLLGIQTGWLTNAQSFNGPAWCISVEIFCYILFYFIVYTGRKSDTAYLTGCVLMAWCGLAVMQLDWWFPILNGFMARGMAGFAVGVFLCEINRRVKDRQKMHEYAVGISVLLAVAVIASKYLDITLVLSSERELQLAIMLILSPLLIVLALTDPVVKKVLERKPFLFLGCISMDIYLWHIPVQIAMKGIGHVFGIAIDYGSNAVWALYIMLVLGIATGSHIMLQKRKVHYFKMAEVVFVITGIFVILIKGMKAGK